MPIGYAAVIVAPSKAEIDAFDAIDGGQINAFAIERFKYLKLIDLSGAFNFDEIEMRCDGDEELLIFSLASVGVSRIIPFLNELAVQGKVVLDGLDAFVASVRATSGICEMEGILIETTT